MPGEWSGVRTRNGVNTQPQVNLQDRQPKSCTIVLRMAGFDLSKWYLDCVTDSGQTIIAYTGVVRWGPMRLDYSSLLRSADGNSSNSAHSLHAHEPSMPDERTLRWRSSELHASGEWSADSSGIRDVIFASGAGSVEWHCLMPRARVVACDLAGFGYAERLVMTIAPWNLPLKMLRWGRFTSASDWVVWIDWVGDFTRRLVYKNGSEVQAAIDGDERIEFEDGSRLIMDRSLTLRNGPLGATALCGIPGLRETAPGRLLRIEECKWRSRACLEQIGRPPVEGWAIHERVEWPE